MAWRPEDPQGNEAAKIKHEIVEFTRGKGLDLGCGPFKTFPHFIGVDNGHHWGTHGVDVVSDCEDLGLFASQSMDFVFSSHLLEHIEDHKAALKEWWRVIKPGGHLVLYLPHARFYPNIGQPGANPDHKHDFMPHHIVIAMEGMPGWDLLVDEERGDGMEYSFLQVYKKTGSGCRRSHRDPLPKKRAAVVRYGGFGDMIQASSVLPGLKAQGFHITFYTTPSGLNIMRTNPYVDRFHVQDPDQVPNEELGAFWGVHSQRFERFINLSESVEGTLLAIAGRINHSWPAAVRRKMLDVNYLEFTHDLAEVPLPARQRFFPTEAEKKWAEKELKRIGGRVIMWVLAGSSVHKTWPWLDQAIARIMVLYPDVKVLLVGDEACQILEQGWEAEPRVIRKSGKLSIRETLTLAEMVDVVVGPETGVLNAVGTCDVPKVLFLSHSSANNISKHWKNTANMEPEGCDCYPCHMLHYGWAHCREYLQDGVGSGVAECQASITCDRFMVALKQFLKE